MTDSRRANRFHRLNRDRGFKVQPGENLKEAKTDEHPNRVHFAQGDIADQKRNERTKVAECPGQLAKVIRIPVFLASHQSQPSPRQLRQIFAVLHVTLLSVSVRCPSAEGVMSVSRSIHHSRKWR